MCAMLIRHDAPSRGKISSPALGQYLPYRTFLATSVPTLVKAIDSLKDIK